MKGLKGRLALVTGGTGLLGGAIATRLAEEQAVVAITSRTSSKSAAWIQESNKVAARYIPLQLDLADEKSISACVDSLEKQSGIPTIIVANASLREGLSVPFEEVTHESFSKLFEVDVAGHILLLRKCVERLDGKAASIIFLSSIYAHVGVDTRIYPEGMVQAPVQYGAVKAAVEGATRWMAAAWGKRGVRVNALVAGGILSAQPHEFVEKYSEKTMLGRMAKVDEVAATATFLASEEASYITGHCLIVDGGLTAW
jgi:NAD(P)-dependent dehydrogenase (short-subunit alcohol dehydrogenase family)